MPVETRKDSIMQYWPEFPIDHASSPALGAWVVNGLAKYGNRLRHAVAGKYVDTRLFAAKSGYSPMTARILLVRRVFPPAATLAHLPTMLEYQLQR